MISKLSQNQKKFIYWLLNAFGILLILFVVVFNGAYWGLNIRPTDTLEHGQIWDLEVVLSVLIPFFVAVICFTSSQYFNIMTKKEVENRLDSFLDNGWVNLDQWIKSREIIEENYSRKIDAKAKQKMLRIEQEQKLIKAEQEKRAEIVKELKETTNGQTKQE